MWISTYGNEGKIKTHEDEIGLPVEFLEQERGNHGYEKVPEPVRGDAN